MVPYDTIINRNGAEIRVTDDLNYKYLNETHQSIEDSNAMSKF